MLEPFLEGQTMDAALAANRIFIVDLEILSRLKLDENKKVGNFKIGKIWMSQSRGTQRKHSNYYRQISFKTIIFVCFFGEVHFFGIIQIRNNDQDNWDSWVSLMHRFSWPAPADFFKLMFLSFGYGIPFLGKQCSLKTHANEPLRSLRYPFLEMFHFKSISIYLKFLKVHF